MKDCCLLQHTMSYDRSDKMKSSNIINYLRTRLLFITTPSFETERIIIGIQSKESYVDYLSHLNSEQFTSELIHCPLKLEFVSSNIPYTIQRVIKDDSIIFYQELPRLTDVVKYEMYRTIKKAIDNYVKAPIMFDSFGQMWRSIPHNIGRILVIDDDVNDEHSNYCINSNSLRLLLYYTGLWKKHFKGDYNTTKRPGH